MISQNGKQDWIVVLISANAEWKSVLKFFNSPLVQESPFGSFFEATLSEKKIVLFQGGWGKISAAASTQYAIDRWKPEVIFNLGTCGGLDGKTSVGEIFLVEHTLVYDIYERMGDPAGAVDFYSTDLELSFLQKPLPQNVRRVRLLSADQDIDPNQVDLLIDDYAAIAADWESGAIAWTARRNNTACVILRGVSDIVSQKGGEIYETGEFHHRAEEIMFALLQALPNWIRCTAANMDSSL